MNENCSDRMCRKHHPHKCKYFLNFGYCKFEASCAYLHPVADVVELTLLKHELKCLKTEIEMIKNKLIYLEKVEIAEHFPLQIKPTCEQKEYSETASFNLSPIPKNDDGTNGENVFNPTPSTMSSHLSEITITEERQQLFSSVRYHPPAFGQGSSSSLFIHTPPSSKNTNKKRLKKIRS